MEKKNSFDFLHIINKSCSKFKNKVFIDDQKEKKTFQEFYTESKKFRDFLISNSKKKHPKVCILEAKKFYDYVAIIGTLMAGGYYIPIHSQTPRDKIKIILSQTKANFFFSSRKLEFSEITKKHLKYISPKDIIIKGSLPQKKYKNSNISYVMYTSGTTGNPKGVIILKKNLNNYIKWLLKRLKVNSNDNISQFISICFDVSICDFFLALCQGSRLILPNKLDYLFPARMIKKNQISHLVCTPSLIDQIDNTKELKKNFFKNLKSIFFCGEPLYKKQVEKIFKANKKILITNAYGPTETTVSVSSSLINKDNYKKLSLKAMSIGKANVNNEIVLLDKNFKRKNEGEIFIAGKQVSPGYLNQSHETKNKFILINKKRFFRTGDLGKLFKGNYFFEGRIDDQVKFRGHRVELEEINFFLRKFGFNNVATILKKNKLISFIQGRKRDNNKINFFLSKNIENFKIPSIYIFLKKFPINKNGKINKKKLFTYA